MVTIWVAGPSAPPALAHTMIVVEAEPSQIDALIELEAADPTDPSP